MLLISGFSFGTFGIMNTYNVLEPKVTFSSLMGNAMAYRRILVFWERNT